MAGSRVVIITGSHGLVGSETAKFFGDRGFLVVGIDNDMRSYFFGAAASTHKNLQVLRDRLGNRYVYHNADIRDADAINKIFAEYGADIALVAHFAAQPSHDWAAREPFTDFGVNANGTLVMLEAARQFAPSAVFIFMSTNKVYGDTPNFLPLVEQPERWELESSHPFAAHGIDESMSIDQSKHSIFGVSKVAADVMVQEYGRYFGMRTGVFRGGCLTGPAHSGAELHGFLSYLVLCAVGARPYTVFGYKGKQVRDNIHSHDLVAAFWEFFNAPRPGEVYNMGGSRFANVSMIEAIRLIEEIAGYTLSYTVSPDARIGDHIWYVSDVRKFQKHYPAWRYEYDIKRTLTEMITAAEGSARGAAAKT